MASVRFGSFVQATSLVDFCDGFLVSEKDSTPEDAESGIECLHGVTCSSTVVQEEARIPVCCTSIRARLVAQTSFNVVLEQVCSNLDTLQLAPPGDAGWHGLSCVACIVGAGVGAFGEHSVMEWGDIPKQVTSLLYIHCPGGPSSPRVHCHL